MATRSGAVHVTTTRRVYKGKVYETHLLRRSIRVGKKVTHETLGNISHLPADLIELIRRGLAGERFVPASSQIHIARSLPHGHVEAILGTIRKLGLEEILSSKRSPERDLVVAMIAERLIEPSSKLATTRLWHSTTLAEQMSVAEAGSDDLYRALDWLLERKERIEKKLASRHLREGGIALYDVTSSYYEGRTCPLVRFGHNRDGKNGRPIIVYGVITNEEGCPVATDVYAGNTADPATVPDQVEKLRGQFGLERLVLVGDRGMLTSVQIDKMREHPGLGWISALRSRQIRDLVGQGDLQLSLFDTQNLAEIHSTDYPGERLVACFNPLLAEERRRKREALLEATEKDLKRIADDVARRKRSPMTADQIGVKAGRVVNRRKMAKHFALEIQAGSLRWQRLEEQIKSEASLDGIYVIRTSEPAERLSAEDAVRRYKLLAQVERGFRCLKGIDLMVRPIWHRLEDHVRAHIFLCLLAYYVEWHMRRALAPMLFADEDLPAHRMQRDPVAPATPSPSAQKKKSTRKQSDGTRLHSFKSLLGELGTRTSNLCRIGDDPKTPTFAQLTTPTPEQAHAFELLGL
jgi:transposase